MTRNWRAGDIGVYGRTIYLVVKIDITENKIHYMYIKSTDWRTADTDYESWRQLVKHIGKIPDGNSMHAMLKKGAK